MPPDAMPTSFMSSGCMVRVLTIAWYSALSLPTLICWPCLVVRPAFMMNRLRGIAVPPARASYQMKRALLALVLVALSLPIGVQPFDTLRAAPSNAEGQSPGVHPLTGRQYALPMSAAGAAWLDRDERQREENTELSLRLLDVRRGSVVADIGAGSGYYSTRLARLVGPEGRVYANDIQQAMLDIIRGRIERERIPNIELVLGTTTDPRLPRAAVDLAIMVDVYHEFSAAAGDAPPDPGVAKAWRTAGAARIPRRGSEGADSSCAQDDGGAGTHRSRS